MENIFDKFKKLNLDTSPIGLSIELREPFFCTPIGAQIIGWDNGIHYCFIKGFEEIVFCVNPETCCNYYVYPLAKDFTDFLRLLLSLKTTNAIQQVVWMDKDAFENFMNDPDEVRYTSSEPVQSILQNISSNLEVEPIENPFDYIKKLQKDFPYKEIKFTDEFYNITGLTRQENI